MTVATLSNDYLQVRYGWSTGSGSCYWDNTQFTYSTGLVVDGDNLDHSFRMTKGNYVYKTDYACMIMKCTNTFYDCQINLKAAKIE
jgi:hypothetical protein